MTREESAAALRGLADALEREWVTVDHMAETLRGLVANCPWQYDAGGSPAFWHHMRAAQRLVDALGKCEYHKLLDWKYAEEARIRAEFARRVEALRATCPHEKSTGWLCDYTGIEVTLCLRCMAETARQGGPRLP